MHITRTKVAMASATHCNTLQHTATHCNTLQHTATHCNVSPETTSEVREMKMHITRPKVAMASIWRASDSLNLCAGHSRIAMGKECYMSAKEPFIYPQKSPTIPFGAFLIHSTAALVTPASQKSRICRWLRNHPWLRNLYVSAAQRLSEWLRSHGWLWSHVHIRLFCDAGVTSAEVE